MLIGHLAYLPLNLSDARRLHLLHPAFLLGAVVSFYYLSGRGNATKSAATMHIRAVGDVRRITLQAPTPQASVSIRSSRIPRSRSGEASGYRQRWQWQPQQSPNRPKLTQGLRRPGALGTVSPHDRICGEQSEWFQDSALSMVYLSLLTS